MSKQEKGRGYDPSEPSTSSGHRKKPYDKDSKIKREASPQPSTSSSSYSEQHESKKVKSDVKSEVKKEDTEQSTSGRRGKSDILVTRPHDLETKRGTSGRPITLTTNHFKLPTVPDWCLYKYRVDFEPEEERTFVRKGMVRFKKEEIGAYIFDGSILYATTSELNKIHWKVPRKSDGIEIGITMRLVGKMTPDDGYYNVIFNIIMRKCLEYLKLQLVGRNYYDAKNKSVVSQFRLELWPGYITTIQQHENNILMCAEIAHKVMRQETLYDILKGCYLRGGNYKEEFSRNVIGIMVLTDYNNHTYRIEDVDYDASPSSTFPMRNGEHVSYQDYYYKKYEIEISEPTQPMLVTRSKPKQRNAGEGDLVYLVPELCRATGLTDSMRENFHLMKALGAYTCLSPDARINKLLKFNSRLREEPKVIQEFKDWNMTLDRSLVEVPGRVLPSSQLTFSKKYSINSGGGDWSRNMQRIHLYNSKQLNNWLVFASERDRNAVNAFLGTLMQVSRQISFLVRNPQMVFLRDDRANTYAGELENNLSRCTPELVFCVVSNNRNDRYSAIKKKCCLDRPVPSQVFLQKNLNGRNAMSIATKVAIQMNCKLGGAPWAVDNPLRGLMAIGFDVCHDVDTRGKDYLSMVATVDQTLTRYFSSIIQFHSGEDLAEQLCTSVRKALMAYRAINQAYPMYLVIYRDGVSEGQIRNVWENEVGTLKKKLEELYYGPNFKMIFIIVNKKINVRLFDHTRRTNPPIGTIVDDVITNPLKYDFFIVSQHVRQGTVSPTSYNVISDNTGLTAEVVQCITFKLTHIYYNCSSTVRVPAPCHYAHKLSLLVGRFLHRPPSTQLENQLFFL
ncbi:hypothetical protein PUN28_007227 [Cardiocondyla obscurior]|uniref:Uncharacterized protein n=1 Tax=Cardiocondyla obscurior TaxID=286306 RepID=A0AAW2G831_9HYME